MLGIGGDLVLTLSLNDTQVCVGRGSVRVDGVVVSMYVFQVPICECGNAWNIMTVQLRMCGYVTVELQMSPGM